MKIPPIVALLTDFGTRDGTVGAMKGAVLMHCPDARILDVSHHVPPQDVVGGAFLLARAIRDLPSTAVHVAVVDPGVGSARRALAARTSDGVWVVGPDNGLLGDAGDAFDRCIVLDPARVVPGTSPSATFHGRDLFAPAGARLARGDDPTALGDAADPPHRLERPVRTIAGGVEGDVVWVDRFGNLVTVLTEDDLAPLGDALAIEVDDVRVERLLRTYSDVERGETLAYWGSHRTLEIGQRNAHFAERHGVGRGSRVRVRSRGA